VTNSGVPALLYLITTGTAQVLGTGKTVSGTGKSFVFQVYNTRYLSGRQ
jgi:hypothetical protein